MRTYLLSLVLLSLVLLALATPALASDGILEINQTCAVQTGCFAGDTPGFPVTIDGSAGRSYRLTSDLVIPNAVTTGIVVNTNDIGIDLNNFAIILSFCVAMTTDCTPLAGTGSGVESTFKGVSVKNGAITGMGNSGVDLGDQAEVRNLRVRWNRLQGIGTSIGSTISGNTAYQNGARGISAGAGSTVSANTSYNNGGQGVFASLGSTISGNTAYSNEGDGIGTGSGVTVQRNTVSFNLGYGLNLGSQTAYRENVITNNMTGTVTGGVNMFSNSCNGTTTCP